VPPIESVLALESLNRKESYPGATDYCRHQEKRSVAQTHASNAKERQPYYVAFVPFLHESVRKRETYRQKQNPNDGLSFPQITGDGAKPEHAGGVDSLQRLAGYERKSGSK
jgi:hypothetical protein